MLGLLTNGSRGLVSTGMALGVVAIVYGVAMLRTGGPNGWWALGLGAGALIVSTIFAALSKTWRNEDGTQRGAGPYDAPSSLNPRYDQYMRMIDPDRERPRRY